MSDDYALKRMGANERDAPEKHNLDVSGTVGPDYLGQETVDVDGHPNDRPGVTSRLPESTDGEHPDISRMDTGEELPVLLSSEMRSDPIEGTQGSYSQIVEGCCARCGYDRLVVSVTTLAGEAQEKCNACGAIQDPQRDDGYRMPTTGREKAKREKEAGRFLTDLLTREVYDMEPDTGYGPYVSLVDDDSTTLLRKDDVASIFLALVENDDIDLAAWVESNLAQVDVLLLAGRLLPDDVEFADSDDE